MSGEEQPAATIGEIHVPPVAVLGGGSFGTALASIASTGGARVRQWMRDEALAAHINTHHINHRYLPDFHIHPDVRASTDLAWVLEEAGLVLIAIPSGGFRRVVRRAAALWHRDAILVSTTKGIETESFMLMSQVLEEETASTRVGVLSGPNLAAEIASGHLSASVIASDDEMTRSRVQAALSCDHFRIYASNDRFGVEMGGALKNIYAIGVGMAAALGMGENTRSMLITRALAEMSRFAVALGASPMTFLGLAGVGDLIVTCSSNLSRNYRVGYAIGEGLRLDEAVEALGQVAEGVNTVSLVVERARREGVYMPLAQGLYRVMFDNADPLDVARELMRGEQSSDVEFTLPREETRRAQQQTAARDRLS